MRTIAIIEDHPIMRKGLADYFEGTGRWRVLGTAPNLEDAENLLSAPALDETPVDILLLDIQLENGWGLDIIPWLRQQYGEKTPAVVVYSAFSDYAHVNAALGMSVRGYVSKSRNETELEAALETVLQGDLYMDKTVEREMTAVAGAISLLTKREAEILTLVKAGLSNKRIAEQLGISRRTVENTLSCVYDKTGISSRIELQKL
jgi:DNA-binding NarL/FixJ family response regulator